MNKHIKIIAVAASWLVIALLLISYKHTIIITGDKVLLETKAVDPRDLLKGDYVRLNYAINTVPNETIDGKRLQTGKRYYVLLAKNDGNPFWQVSGVTDKKPAGGIFLIGRKQWSRMVYGIEEYYVPEGKGLDIERKCGEGLAVEAAVTKSGLPAISRLFFNNEELKIREK
ncbi:MAG: GDYXXLXY domain-containing protein [Elusimicrobiota bacterium]